MTPDDFDESPKPENTMQTSHQILPRILAFIALFAAMHLVTSPPHASGQDIRLLTYTRTYEKIVGNEFSSASTNFGPANSMTKQNISVNWCPTDAGNNTRKFHFDGFYGGAGVQALPKGGGVWDSLDYVSDEWPALPGLGTNITWNGPGWLFSESLLTNIVIGDVRGGGEYRYASYTNTTSTTTNQLGLDALGNWITLTNLSTNYVSETAKWTAAMAIGNVTEGTNSFWVEVKYKPMDDNGVPVPPGEISLEPV